MAGQTDQMDKVFYEQRLPVEVTERWRDIANELPYIPSPHVEKLCRDETIYSIIGIIQRAVSSCRSAPYAFSASLQRLPESQLRFRPRAYAAFVR